MYIICCALIGWNNFPQKESRLSDEYSPPTKDFLFFGSSYLFAPLISGNFPFNFRHFLIILHKEQYSEKSRRALWGDVSSLHRHVYHQYTHSVMPGPPLALKGNRALSHWRTAKLAPALLPHSHFIFGEAQC